jgi:hypothetical protein
MRRVAIAILLLALTFASEALAQSRSLTDELMRKAESTEMESGFCVTTNWPSGPSLEEFTAFLKSASVGTSKVNLFADGKCQLDQVTRTHMEKGGKCVTYDSWICDKGGLCGKISTLDCLNSAGMFVTRRNP